MAVVGLQLEPDLRAQPVLFVDLIMLILMKMDIEILLALKVVVQFPFFMEMEQVDLFQNHLYMFLMKIGAHPLQTSMVTRTWILLLQFQMRQIMVYRYYTGMVPVISQPTHILPPTIHPILL